MLSAYRARPPHTEAANRRRSRAWARRLVGALLAASGCAASLALLPATSQAQQHSTAGTVRAASAFAGVSSVPGSAVSAFCAHFSTTKVSSIVGSTVLLGKADALSSNSFECRYFAIGAKTAGEQVIISRDTNVPASELSSRTKAEARLKAESPKGLTITFTSLPSLGPTAFSWTYELNGGRLVGVGNNRGTTAWGALVGGNIKLMGAAAAHVPVIEKLIELDMAVAV